MSKGRFYISFVILFVGLLSCGQQLSYDEYKAFVSDPENGLRKDLQLGEFELSAMYEPADYLVAKNNEVLTKEEYEEFEHFQFRIKLIEGGNILMYKETESANEVTRINHFGFFAHEDFKIYTDSDTSLCKLAHFSRNYNLSPSIDISLAFNKISKNSDWQLVYTDTQFGFGTVKFLFKEEVLTDLPELKK